jgi:hypothetical protein
VLFVLIVSCLKGGDLFSPLGLVLCVLGLILQNPLAEVLLHLQSHLLELNASGSLLIPQLYELRFTDRPSNFGEHFGLELT